MCPLGTSKLAEKPWDRISYCSVFRLPAKNPRRLKFTKGGDESGLCKAV